MIVDGETYACEGCIRGHRTRSCQHGDRPLQHIKAKGRPVSQCSHCRAERKNRSAHVKCQCGKRAAEGGADCGCFSGERCRCATKKSPRMEPRQLDALSELSSPANTSPLDTASPAQPPTALGFDWSTAATPTSGLMPLDGLPEFDPDAWLGSEQIDAGGFDPNLLPNAGGGMATVPDLTSDMLAPNFQQQISEHMSNTHMGDGYDANGWPAVGDVSAKELFAMMDSSTGLNMSGLGTEALDPLELGSNPHSNFEFDFSAISPLPPPAQTQAETGAAKDSKCGSKPEQGCGPCCG